MENVYKMYALVKACKWHNESCQGYLNIDFIAPVPALNLAAATIMSYLRYDSTKRAPMGLWTGTIRPCDRNWAKYNVDFLAEFLHGFIDLVSAYECRLELSLQLPVSWLISTRCSMKEMNRLKCPINLNFASEIRIIVRWPKWPSQSTMTIRLFFQLQFTLLNRLFVHSMTAPFHVKATTINICGLFCWVIYPRLVQSTDFCVMVRLHIQIIR